ncbi:trinucleotide repeat-containing gene 6A protein isoform X2 [Varanus komodoensis]|uniref:trinucleotide repeat-containing gene 6A protein isoform X2 n=1 Tax=Varanus komodoensis TaxID=61221 RepID=UPI001CF7CACD|nr:trinucleotide repeat-containing gene 6A protein isoform X2 [Varanus komodoensis]
MEERKKRKDDKKKKEAAQKKAAEQKHKATSEPTKPSVCNPLLATSTSATSAAAGGTGASNNARRVVGSSQQQAQPQPSPRYPPREVPPRFRHQEQKQLLKRGEPLPGIAALLGSAAKLVSPSERSTATSEEPAAGSEGQQSNQNQPDLRHSTAGPHYESSGWGAAPSGSDSSTKRNDAFVDGLDKETWPSITGSDLELVPECMGTDAASSSGSEKNLVTMASSGDIRNGLGHSSQTKFDNSTSSNNVGSGSLTRPWSAALGAVMGTCQVPAEALNGISESSTNRMNSWGTLGSPSGELNPSPSCPNGHHGARPASEHNGRALKGAVGGGSPSLGPAGSSPGGSGGLGNSWGSLQESCDSQANGTRKVLRGGQPQNAPPDMNGPNSNTTNFLTSSLPNPAGSMQVTEPAPGPGTWCLSARSGRSPPQASPVINGTSALHLSNGEAKNVGAPGTVWGTCGPGYSREACPESGSRASDNTVNATLTQPGLGGASGDNGAGAWEVAGAGSSQGTPWAGGIGVASGEGRRGPGQSTNSADGEWNKLPSTQRSSEGTNGNGKKFTNMWKSVEEESAAADLQSFVVAAITEQDGGWAKTSTGGSEGHTESPAERAAVDGPGRERRKVDHQALLQSIVNRTDLDPRVLSNSGWGQTPVKQNTAWDTEMSPRVEKKADNGTEAWGGCAVQASSSGGIAERPSLNGGHAPPAPRWGEPKLVTRWGDSRASGSQGSWEEGPAAAPPAKGSQSWAGGREDQAASPWGEGEKLKQGWGDGPKANPVWAAPAVEGWGDNSRSNHWGEGKKSSSGSSDSDRSGSGWRESGKPSAVPWGGGSGPKPRKALGWEEPPKPNQGQGWGEPPKAGRSQSWGEVPKAPSSPDWHKQCDTGCWGAQAASKPPGVGWLGGPMPAPVQEEEPTGWEEPSPESIRRKIEIDDGTSAWGDPSKYNYKNVNMWNKNTVNGVGRADPQGLLSGPGTAAESGSGWVEPPPTPAAVDNGTSAWGKPVDAGASWGESIGEALSSSGWGNAAVGQPASQKPGPKSMQVPDGWCGGEMPLTGDNQASWEEEDEVEIRMWNSNSVQDTSVSSHWPPCSKKPPLKGTTKNGNKQEEMWINPFVKQFASLGFPRESPEELMHSNKMDIAGGILADKRAEMEKHSLNVGEYSRVTGKGPNSRPQISKESSVDRIPYFDKNGNPTMFGNLTAQPRNMPQSPAQSNPRAQVPPPLISPQVPVSLLKYTPNSGGLNPLFGPQHVAMLNQLSQLSQISHLQRLLAQQRKIQNQRSVPAGCRQLEQQSRSLSLQQQAMQLDPHLLLKQQQQQHLPPSQQLHQNPVKSFLESVVSPATPELQKAPPHMGAFSSFPTGLNSNLNVNMDVGHSIKEPQSRLRKWTTVDSISANTSLDQNASKNGAIPSGFRLEEASFVPYDFVNSSHASASPPGSIGDGWPRAKSPNGPSSVNWPPEFRPGEPWKGYPNIDPETDPYITPGSVTNNLSINTVREADRLRDRNSGSSSSLNTTLPSTSAWSSIRASNYNVSLTSTAQSTSSARNSDSKSTWSPASINNSSLAHELWKVPLPPKSMAAPSRPPPGLTGQKLSLSAWDNCVRLGGGWSNSDAGYTPGASWGESSSGRITNCLVLKNLTPQIDGSTLRTLCMQHGPLKTFHLNLPCGNALVQYGSKEEVMKAQKSLHMCVLGNTTILAEFASEEEISRFFAQGPSLTPSPAWQSLGAGQNRPGSLDGSRAFSHRSDLNTHWNGAGLAGTSGGDLHDASLWGSPSYSTSLWGSLGSSEAGGPSSPSPLHAFLSVDHLGPGGESL